MGNDRRAGQAEGPGRSASAGAVMLGIALALAGLGMASQEPPAQEPAVAPGPSRRARRRRPRGRARGRRPRGEGSACLRSRSLPRTWPIARGPTRSPAPADRGAMRPGADAARPADPVPRQPPAAATVTPTWPFHYELTMAGWDGSPLATRYYPSEQGPVAAVVLLVHDLGAGRSAKDFEDPIAELEGQGIAGHLQELGYAVIAIDLRGHGQSPSRAARGAEAASPRMMGDLQAVYRFLIDRHNRRELNLSKLGVVGLGTGANLAAIWAATPGGGGVDRGADQRPRRPGPDLPEAEAGGRPLGPLVSSLAPRLPMMLEAGSKRRQRRPRPSGSWSRW